MQPSSVRTLRKHVEILYLDGKESLNGTMTLLDRARTVFGVIGGALEWMRSFVTGRAQFIAVGSERSDTVACSSGVPQGSVLGPILFGIMYV